jgi:hypothetical protein
MWYKEIFFIIINVGVRVRLRASQLISLILKLTIMKAFLRGLELISIGE